MKTAAVSVLRRTNDISFTETWLTSSGTTRGGIRLALNKELRVTSLNIMSISLFLLDIGLMDVKLGSVKPGKYISSLYSTLNYCVRL